MWKFYLGLVIGMMVGAVGTVVVLVAVVFYGPAMANTSRAAQINSVTSTLQTVRSQIELFKIQHADTPPTEAGMWVVMMGKSNEGDVERPNAKGKLGPYLQAAPVNPLNGQSAVSSRPGPKVGWVYEVSGSTYTLRAVNKRGDGVEAY